MNVIVSNRQKDIIDNANIDAIKDLNGLFNVDDLIVKFKNYFFSKMIIDATSIVDFASKEVLTTLANAIGPEKLIILLPSTPEPPLEFKQLLIDLKIYNFTNDINDVIRFIEQPNTYDDVMKLLNDSSDNQMDTSNEKLNTQNNNQNINNVNNDFNDGGNNSNNISNTNQGNNSASLGDILSGLNVNNAAVANQNIDNSSLNSTTNEKDSIATNDSSINSIVDGKNLDNISSNLISESITQNNSEPASNFNDNFASNQMNMFASNESKVLDGKNTFLITDDFVDTNQNFSVKKVIGIVGVTLHAGCTSLIYMLHRMASISLKKSVLSIEVGKSDFRLYRDSSMISVSENELKNAIDNSNAEIIFIDLNDCRNFELCNEVLYLVEPSTIKLNDLMAKNKNVFRELSNQNFVLNMSLLSPNDVRTLESEAGIHFFDIIEPLNDRIFNDSINKLLDLLGIK